MKINSNDSFKSIKKIKVDNKTYNIFSLKEAEKSGLVGISKLPKSLKILLENLLRFEDNHTVKKEQVIAIKNWLKDKKSNTEISYRPARVLMQDYTGIPAVADLAAMRDEVKSKKKDPNKINPSSSVDLVIDHSVMVDAYASKDSFKHNVEKEFLRNGERYSFLKWGQKAFNNFRVVPPGTGICHQVNLEYLSKVVWTSESEGNVYAYPDTLVGTDSHTTMVNSLSVLGWGVGGIEAEAAMLGQPISMLIPEVIGFKLNNKLPEGTTATDLVLTIVELLRKKGVVGKFVEFFGSGLKNLSLADRATIANMAPEYGATCGFFPIDEETIKYLLTTSADPEIGGVVFPSTREYESGSTANLIAAPAVGYVFESWTGATGDSVTTLVVDGDKTVVGKFVKKQFGLTVNITGEGTVGQKVIKERTQVLKSKKADLDLLSNESKEEEKKLDALKTKASKKIEPSLLLSYEKLVNRQRNGLAVVKVSRGACGGCFNIVPPQRQAEIKEKKKIILCEYCGRILADVIAEVVVEKPKKRTKRKTTTKTKKTTAKATKK